MDVAYVSLGSWGFESQLRFTSNATIIDRLYVVLLAILGSIFCKMGFVGSLNVGYVPIFTKAHIVHLVMVQRVQIICNEILMTLT